jgi:nicotinate dehydrogenase subunit B
MSQDLSRTSRREILTGGALVVSFALTSRALAQLAGGGEGRPGPPVLAPKLQGSLRSTPWLDAWIRIDAQGQITVFTGKAELGQGIRTALLQVAAEELDVAPKALQVVTADTARTPNEGLTAGSHSMQDSGTAIRNAAANVRLVLVQAAAKLWHVPIEVVSTSGDGRLNGPMGRTLGYGPVAAGLSMHIQAFPDVPLRDPHHLRTIGHSLPRVDLPAKLTGGAAFIQDFGLPGLLHARVVRGPSEGTKFGSIDLSAARAIPGVRVLQEGGLTAVLAADEWAAIRALRRLEKAPYHRQGPPLPIGIPATLLKAMACRDITVSNTNGQTAPAVKRLLARYSRPWLSHGSIGPSCAVAHYDGAVLTVWTHSQSTFDVRRFVAELIGLPLDRVHAIHSEGAGCYGQNGADDVAADAAVIAKAMPGIPIRLQWMREQEFGWEPLGPGMATEVEAALDASNRIVAWRHEIWSNRHNARPQTAGGTIAGAESQPAFAFPDGEPIPMPEGDGDRNSNPLYDLPNQHIVFHFIPKMPIRVSALRSLGAHLNVFSIECMFDELAKAANLDPLAMRLAHMSDTRASAVMQKAADWFGWSRRKSGDGRNGNGLGFARYKNLGAYCAVAMAVEVDRDTGQISIRRAVAAVDVGQAVNPDGVRNQLEGGIIQSLSWCTCEAISFDSLKRTSFDWSTYPILRFSQVPDSIDVLVIDRPGAPFLGAGEAAQGPTSAALANAFADATGVRLRDMPLSPERVLAALDKS